MTISVFSLNNEVYLVSRLGYAVVVIDMKKATLKDLKVYGKSNEFMETGRLVRFALYYLKRKGIKELLGTERLNVVVL